MFENTPSQQHSKAMDLQTWGCFLSDTFFCEHDKQYNKCWLNKNVVNAVSYILLCDEKVNLVQERNINVQH